MLISFFFFCFEINHLLFHRYLFINLCYSFYSCIVLLVLPTMQYASLDYDSLPYVGIFVSSLMTQGHYNTLTPFTSFMSSVLLLYKYFHLPHILNLTSHYCYYSTVNMNLGVSTHFIVFSAHNSFLHYYASIWDCLPFSTFRELC